MKVFLGGTCNGSRWRDLLIPLLKIDYFNPVVDDWDEKAYQRELHERATCDYCLYFLTPKSISLYSVAELIDDSNKRPEKVVFAFWSKDDDSAFNEHQLKALSKIEAMVRDNGGAVFQTLAGVATALNNATI